jgi:hypothetical protein
VDRLADLVPFINQGPSATLFTGGNWNAKVQGDEMKHVDGDATTITEKNCITDVGGYTHSHYKGKVLTKCENDNDTIVKGNYTCRVDGYQEYSTKGDYTTNVWGKNFVTIVGLDHNKKLAVQINLVAGAKIEFDKTKDVLKTPFVQRQEGRVQKKIGEYQQKAASKKEKIAGQKRVEADEYDVTASHWIGKFSAECTRKAAKLREKADDYELKAGTIKQKGDLNVTEGTAKINGVFKATS